MPKVSGSIRGLQLNGVSYNVAADANLTFNPSKFENDIVIGSGDPIRKMMKRNQDVEGIVILVDSDEDKTLAELSESLEDVTMGVTLADGTVYSSSGWFNYESRESEEARGTLKLFPRKRWAKFSS